MKPLPLKSSAAIARIEAMLDEAERLGPLGDQELTYQLKQTSRRYLPDTVSAYLSIPASQRDSSTDVTLLNQLLLIEASTRDRLAALAHIGRDRQSENGEFLKTRFGR